ncbi:cellulase family glycosylhydrolase [Streptomyces sp. NBC_01465]|uniref:cellulase family glycosylhydrolase n=1 Tax=Streptomyces sp. NBC_01465 TaxID=2903878 RepID=UPI002E2F43C1|nr:cellulase family glycosylhydrolase [Streptomyces sp. NBC_01465]
MRHRRFRIASGLAATLLIAAGTAAVPSSASAATAGCEVAYLNLSTWQSTPTSGGFNTTLAIKNLGDPTTRWKLTFTMPSGQTATGGWNATFAGATSVTATDAGWNGTIATGQTSSSVGLQGEWTRTAAGTSPPNPLPQPADFALNGVPCTGAPSENKPPSVNLTSPQDGASFEAPATIGLAATASDADGSVGRVEFLNGSTVIGSDTTAPYAFAWTNVTRGNYALSARAVDDDGATTTSAPAKVAVTGQDAGGPAPALHVSGNQLRTASGATYRLLGVNRSGGEYACFQGKPVFDGPADQASVDAMKAWNIHAVRLPLNEECWLGTADVPADGVSGEAYRQAVKDYADLLVANGINPILDLHWTYGQYGGPGAGCADAKATCQKPMPDAQYTPAFWTQVAQMFKGNDAVVFDLFNEPYPDAANNWSDATEAWTCLRDGGTCTGIDYKVAGMQTLLNAVRDTGATNVVMTGGLTWTNDLTQWLTYKPVDPAGNLMASWHSYNFNACVTAACWDSQIGAVAAQVPVTAGEVGQNTCAHDYLDQVTDWADSKGVGYLAWTWNPWGVCAGSGNDLIADWNGTPTSTYGEAYKAHLLTQNPT